MRRLAAVLLLVVAAAVTGCAAGPSLDQPPSIRYGKDACDQCGMIINEARFAAAYVTEDGTVRRFDDLGDMLAYDAEHRESVARFWVHDYRSGRWLRAPEAWYVQATALVTPMGHGLVAVAERAEAERLARARGGVVRRWRELVRRP